ncbi:MAG: hypothetical protein R2813_12025 [Flavobacteriales bacterium]
MIWVLLAVSSCNHEPYIPAVESNSLIVRLKWNQSYPGETIQAIDTGLLWTFSLLGAELERGALDASRSWKQDTVILDISKLGFSVPAENAFKEILNYMRSSEEYRELNCIDLGRFVTILLCNSDNYYNITGIPRTLDEYLSQRTTRKRRTMILNSNVSLGPRIVEIPDSVEPLDQFALVAIEGEFDSLKGKVNPEEYEVIDFLANGQLRFGVYSKDGALVDGANSNLSIGGKPSKCMWCHESSFNPNFNNSQGHIAYLSVDSFNHIIKEFNKALNDQRLGLSGDVDFGIKQDHQYAELIYLGFMHPTDYRLSKEWGISVSQVESRLSHLPKHDYHEFEFLMGCFERADVDIYSPFKVIPVLEDERELN